MTSDIVGPKPTHHQRHHPRESGVLALVRARTELQDLMVDGRAAGASACEVVRTPAFRAGYARVRALGRERGRPAWA